MVVERPIEGFSGWGRETRKPLSRAALFTIGAVGLVHVAGAVYLYYVRTVAPALPQDPGRILTVETLHPAHDKPKETPPPKSVVRIHEAPRTAEIPPTATVTAEPQPKADIVPDTPPVLADKPQPPPQPKPPEPQPKVIRNPSWISRPTAEQLAEFYPPRAIDDGVGGQATLDCKVTANGQLTACTVSGETPTGYGFAAAALKASRIFRMTPRTEDGEPVEGGVVHIPMRFATQ